MNPFIMNFPFSSTPELLRGNNMRYVDGVFESICKQMSNGVPVYLGTETNTNPIGKSVGVKDGVISIEIIDDKFLYMFGFVGENDLCIGTCMEAESDYVDGVQVINYVDVHHLMIMLKSYVSSELIPKQDKYSVITKESTLDLGTR